MQYQFPSHDLKGKYKDNEHYHIFVPGRTKSDADRYRNRVKKLGLYGNGKFSIKCCENGIAQAITYGAREKTQPIVRGDWCYQWISDAPEWKEQPRASGSKRKRPDDLGIRLTSANFLKLCFEYRNETMKHTDDLVRVMEAMLNNGYYMDPSFSRTGAPDFFKDVFKQSCELQRLNWDGILVRSQFFRPFNPKWS